MNYQETLDYMFSRLPMYQRIGAAAYKANLDNTIKLCNLLDNPEEKFKSIHIAGTNGKGSTSHLLASVLQNSGYKVGLYTSPHLKDFRERIKINGAMIPEKTVTDFVQQHIVPLDKTDLQLSFFEMTVGLAFDYFAKENVDIAVIEVGLGGRLDSTNVITPELSIITNISYDHMNLLGSTLEEIAKEKAGIIKRGVPVIIGEKQLETQVVFINKSTESNTPIVFASDVYHAKNLRLIKNHKSLLSMNVTRKGNIVYPELDCELTGMYQQKNIPTVLCAIDHLKKMDYYIPETSIRCGFRNVVTHTGLLGRWQVLSESPLIIADTGHNEAGIKEVINQINSTPHESLHIVLGVVNDKDISSMLCLLPATATYYFCKANIPRALPAEELANQAKVFNLNGTTFSSVNEALSNAKQNAGKNDLIFVGGSTFTVAEIV